MNVILMGYVALTIHVLFGVVILRNLFRDLPKHRAVTEKYTWWRKIVFYAIVWTSPLIWELWVIGFGVEYLINKTTPKTKKKTIMFIGLTISAIGLGFSVWYLIQFEPLSYWLSACSILVLFVTDWLMGMIKE